MNFNNYGCKFIKDSSLLCNILFLFFVFMLLSRHNTCVQVGVSNMFGWVKRVTGEKHVNPYITRLIKG